MGTLEMLEEVDKKIEEAKKLLQILNELIENQKKENNNV